MDGSQGHCGGLPRRQHFSGNLIKEDLCDGQAVEYADARMVFQAYPDVPKRSLRSEAKSGGGKFEGLAACYGQVNISPVGETASVQSENLKMPEAMGRAMTADVERWSRGETACSSSAVAGTWSPQSPDAKGAVSKASSKAPGVKKIKSKVAAQKPATP